MRRIAVINQKGGVGKTTTCANLGAALARLGRRVVLVDMDPQANLSLHLGQELFSEDPSSYTVLAGDTPFEAAIRGTAIPGLSIVPAHIDLSGAELELASSIGRETLLRDAIDDWERAAIEGSGEPPADYLIMDCPPSLGLLSVNAMAAAREVLIAVQTEFFALQGMSKLVEVIQLLRRRLNPGLRIRGILPCLYDSRLRLAREVLAEVRRYFPGQVFRTSIRTNIKLAEAPSHGRTIFEYDPSSTGATDHMALANEILEQEGSAAGETPGEASKASAEALGGRLVEMTRTARSQAVPAGEGPSSPAPDPAPSPGALANEPIVQDEPRQDAPDPGVAAEAAEDQIEPIRGRLEGPVAAKGPQMGSIRSEIEDRAEEAICAASKGLITAPCAPGDTPSAESGSVEERESAADSQTNLASGELAPQEDPSCDPEEAPDSELQEVEVPRPTPSAASSPAKAAKPTASQPLQKLNYAGLYGEDRPHMAGRMGPRSR